MSTKQRTLILDSAQIDWLTLTSWELTSWQFWREMLDESPDVAQQEGTDSKQLMQYSGLEFTGPYGTAYLGTAFIKSREHIMLRLSGELAERLFLRAAKNPINEAWGKCTRIDLQITSEPKGWSQKEFYDRIYKPYRPPSYVSSFDKRLRRELATIYVGKRKSERMARIYEKPDEDKKVYLRFESEFKGDVASAVCKAMVGKASKRQEYLLGEIQAIGDSQLESVYALHLIGQADRVSVRRVQMSDKTRDWLMGVVLQSLDRYLNQHDHDGDVLHSFAKLISDHYDRYRPERGE